MSKFYLETERLIIRELREEDIEDFISIISHDKVGANLPRGRGSTREEAEKTFMGILDYNSKVKIGINGVIRKSDNKFIGYCGLRKIEALDKIEILYSFNYTYWGKGFATESAKAILNKVEEMGELKKIIGITKLTNFKSMGVLGKLNFKYMGIKKIFGMEFRYFEKILK